MAKREKAGRRASKEDRARARSLVASYYRGLSSIDSSYCINPEDEPEEQIFAKEADVETLITALLDFADHGTFALMGTGDFEQFLLRSAMKDLMSTGMTYEAAAVKLAEKHNMSERTVTRRIAVLSKRDTD